MTTATHNGHDTTPERVLFVAFELSEKTWKLGFTTGHGQKPRERSFAAGHQARLLQEVAQAKRRFSLPETAPVVSCYEAGREGFWLHRHRKPPDQSGRCDTTPKECRKEKHTQGGLTTAAT